LKRFRAVESAILHPGAGDHLTGGPVGVAASRSTDMAETRKTRPSRPGEVTLRTASSRPAGDGDVLELPVVQPGGAVNERGSRPDWLRV